MPLCACHGLLLPSREGQPQWIFLLFPAKRTQRRGPRHPGRATWEFICTLISASKRRLVLFFTTRVHQVFYDPTGFLCPENRDSNLASGELDLDTNLRQKVCLASPKYSFGRRIEIIFSSTNYFCESKKCCTITFSEVLAYSPQRTEFRLAIPLKNLMILW